MPKNVTPAVLIAGPLGKTACAVNLALLAALPYAWFQPVMKLSTPFLVSTEISIARGVYELYRSDLFLFLVVFVFGMAVPFLKILLYAYLWLAPLRRAPLLLATGEIMARLSMTDVFVFALFLVVFKLRRMALVEVMSGLHLFTLVILASLAASLYTARWFGRAFPAANVDPPAST